jgi:hypothetical protein
MCQTYAGPGNYLLKADSICNQSPKQVQKQLIEVTLVRDVLFKALQSAKIGAKLVAHQTNPTILRETSNVYMEILTTLKHFSAAKSGKLL